MSEQISKINPEYKPFPRISLEEIASVLDVANPKPFSLDFMCAALRDLRDAREALAAQAELDAEDEVTDAEIEAGARALFCLASQLSFVLSKDLQKDVRKLELDRAWNANKAFYYNTARAVLEAAKKARLG
jgi:hypothetical protein